ncbi:hypothetical protein AAFC00_001890 [Neodothiora populina]|uniref:Ribosome biogenesis protein Urb1 n=1 Tax=Neodothiora populina TaxID=2781224 RepID=A0ABR3PQG9_9PEZI
MGKRIAEAEEEQRDAKRPKTQNNGQAIVPATDIWSARQLQTLLSFSQDAVQQLRNGIQSFKGFLELILYSDDPNRPAKINILNDYLDVFKARADKDSSVEYLPDFMQAWNYAHQTNNDYLATSITSILALLLKTLATLIDSREHGVLLCRTLLKPAQLKLISRGVSAPKTKEHIISPCLRILTEIVSFDGGVMAKSLYSKREWSFESKIMARNLGLSKGEEDRRRPSVRSNAVRYLLANFRYQDEGAKMDILRHGHILKALFDHLKDDLVEVLQDVFKVIETHILRDDAIPRATKSHAMGERSLSGILAALRTQSNSEIVDLAPQVDGEVSAAAKGKAAIFSFLRLVCTTPSLGILRTCGWYPPGSEKHTRDETEEPEADIALDLGLDSVDWYDRYHSQVPVRNTILSGFIQGLRPHGNAEERALLLAIFEAGPELVADYFFTKADKFPFDPKLTNTWIGYASFLFSAVEIPFPQYFGPTNGFVGCPPPVTIAIENILPFPLSQKVLVRCLNQSSSLITFFTIRILVVAFSKLRKVLQAFDKAATEANTLWREASTRLLLEFNERCPPMKDVVATFRKTSDDNILQKEAVSRLLSLYYQVTPQFALGEKFDVSTSLTSALSRIEIMDITDEQYSIRLIELEHLLVIAQCSSGMRWWHKQGSLKFSPFVTLLRLCAQMPKDQAIKKEFLKLIDSVVSEHDSLQFKTEKSSVEALIASLSPTTSWQADNATYTFLDECFGRVVRKPVKYLDDLETFSGGPAQDHTVSLLLIVCLEQAPFASNLSPDDRSNVMTWLSLFIGLLKVIGESQSVLKYVESEIDLPSLSKDDAELHSILDSVVPSSAERTEQRGNNKSKEEHKAQTSPSIEFALPAPEKMNRPELTRWQQKDIEESVEDGDVASLVYCLSSHDSSIRLQALAAIRRLIPKIQESLHEEKDQLYILLGEIMETATNPQLLQPLAEQPLPYLTTAFANHAITVLLDPSHFMYPKVNKYLNKGPSWQIMKIASYWVDKTLLEMPEEDDKHWAEVEWVLEFCVDGTRSLQDALLLISRNTLEKILAISASPAAPKAVRDKIMQLIYRVAKAGGATSLLTRTAILAWLDIRKSMKDADLKSLEHVREAVFDNIEEARLSGWSKGSWNKNSLV